MNNRQSYCVYHDDSLVKYVCCEKNCPYDKMCCGDCFVDTPHTQHKSKKLPEIQKYLNELIQYTNTQENNLQSIIPDLQNKIISAFDNIYQVIIKQLNDSKNLWMQYINDKLIINQDENQQILCSIQPSIFLDTLQNNGNIDSVKKVLDVLQENLGYEQAYQKLFQGNQQVQTIKEKISSVMDNFEKDMLQFLRNEFQECIPQPDVMNSINKNYIDLDKFKGICKKQYVEHKQEINSLLFVGNNLFVSGSDDQSIKFWNINQNKPVATLNGFDGIINHLILINDELLACRGGQMKNDIFLINYKNFSIYNKLTNCHRELILRLEILNRNTIVSCSGDLSIKFWDVESGEMIQEIPQAHTQVINDITLFNYTLLLSSSEDKIIKVWNYQTYKLVCQRSMDNYYHGRLLKLTSNQFASGSLQQINIWLLKDNKIEQVNNFTVHKHWISQLIVVNKDYIASCSEDSSIKILNWKTGKIIHSLEKNLEGKEVNTLNTICKTNNNTILSAGKDGVIYEWK